jgi:exodeoxyribonuclease V alpha subunit
MAKRITDRFGANTLEVIENDITRLAKVEGIGSRRVRMIAEAWEAQKQIKEIMLFLQTHQVSTTLAVKIYKSYGDQSIKIVKNDPYRLARDIYGIGFLSADKIARNIGLAADAPQRVAAGIEYTLNQMADQGHVFVPRAQLVEAAAKILAVNTELVGAQLEALRLEDRVKVETIALDEPQGEDFDEQNSSSVEAIYLPPLYYAEVGVASNINRLQQAEVSRVNEFSQVNWDQAFAWLATSQSDGLTLAEGQRQAVRMALTNKVTILTGGPGTGKTSTVRAVLQLLATKGKSALLAAPTGRAAKRLAESTGVEAKTIHRLLEVSPSEGFKFQRNQDNPLTGDILILDECSMIDMVLMNSVLKAVHPASHLVLVGDVDQLPSVGAGNVLRDLIASGFVPVTRLDVIFR